MSRTILIFGQPGCGKSYSLKNLDPKTTIIIDADCKSALPWRGWKKDYSKERKTFVAIDTLDGMNKSINKIATAEEWKHIKTIVIDGLSNPLNNEVMFYDERNKAANPFEKYSQVAKKATRIFNDAQKFRDDLTVVFIGHVETADPYTPTDVDKLFTPGKYLQKVVKPESKFLYVFQAKSEDGEFFFETVPNKSTARSPEGCFPPKIPNDLAAAIAQIEKYEMGEE